MQFNVRNVDGSGARPNAGSHGFRETLGQSREWWIRFGPRRAPGPERAEPWVVTDPNWGPDPIGSDDHRVQPPPAPHLNQLADFRTFHRANAPSVP